MGVSKNNATPKWMVKVSLLKWDDLGGFPPIFGNTHILETGDFQVPHFHMEIFFSGFFDRGVET